MTSCNQCAICFRSLLSDLVGIGLDVLRLGTRLIRCPPTTLGRLRFVFL